MKGKLSKREKFILYVGGSLALVSAGTAIYFGVKYYKQNVKLNNQKDMTDILLNDVCGLVDENDFNRTMIIEGGIIPAAIQNLKNKKSRYENKLVSKLEAFEKRPNDKDLENVIFDIRTELVHVTEQLYKAEKLQARYDNDQIIYAK